MGWQNLESAECKERQVRLPLLESGDPVLNTPAQDFLQPDPSLDGNPVRCVDKATPALDA